MPGSGKAQEASNWSHLVLPSCQLSDFFMMYYMPDIVDNISSCLQAITITLYNITKIRPINWMTYSWAICKRVQYLRTRWSCWVLPVAAGATRWCQDNATLWQPFQPTYKLLHIYTTPTRASQLESIYNTDHFDQHTVIYLGYLA